MFMRVRFCGRNNPMIEDMVIGVETLVTEQKVRTSLADPAQAMRKMVRKWCELEARSPVKRSASPCTFNGELLFHTRRFMPLFHAPIAHPSFDTWFRLDLGASVAGRSRTRSCKPRTAPQWAGDIEAWLCAPISLRHTILVCTLRRRTCLACLPNCLHGCRAAWPLGCLLGQTNGCWDTWLVALLHATLPILCARPCCL